MFHSHMSWSGTVPQNMQFAGNQCLLCIGWTACIGEPMQCRRSFPLPSRSCLHQPASVIASHSCKRPRRISTLECRVSETTKRSLPCLYCENSHVHYSTQLPVARMCEIADGLHADLLNRNSNQRRHCGFSGANTLAPVRLSPPFSDLGRMQA